MNMAGTNPAAPSCSHHASNPSYRHTHLRVRIALVLVTLLGILAAAESLAVRTPNAVHCAWRDSGRIFYQETQAEWSSPPCRLSSDVPPVTEPASLLSVGFSGQYIYCRWESPSADGSAAMDTWERRRSLSSPALEWELPMNLCHPPQSPIGQRGSLVPESRNFRFSMRRVTLLPAGPATTAGGSVLCCDSDHDGRPEVIFAAGSIYPNDYLRWDVWEHRPMNEFDLVYSDTGAYPYRPGITTGNFRPWDAGDIDRDGLADLVGLNEEHFEVRDTMHNLGVTQESPDTASYPEALSWYYWIGTMLTPAAPWYFTNDLDGDQRREILNATPSDIGLGIWENTANNANDLVWSAHGFGGGLHMPSVTLTATATRTLLRRVSVRLPEYRSLRTPGTTSTRWSTRIRSTSPTASTSSPVTTSIRTGGRSSMSAFT